MDGKGCWRDNIFVERLWRSLKFEEIYLHGCDSVSAATAGIGRHLTLYNTRRPHSSLTDRTVRPGILLPAADPAAAVRRSLTHPAIYFSSTEKRSHFSVSTGARHLTRCGAAQRHNSSALKQ
jgi:putative transposase